MKDTAVRFQQAGIPIGGIGVQGHMHDIDLTLVQARLDILAEAGLPIVITEFAVNEQNETLKAEKLVDLMTMFYGHPSVDGVVFWGFWDGRIWEPDAYLFSGENVTANAAGIAYQELYHNTWRTRDFQTLLGSEEYSVRGFKGDYMLKVKHDGKVLMTHEFQLPDGGSSLEIHLNGTSGGSPSVSHVVAG
ncbi:anti-sigma-I factor RsgI6-like [Mercenaria mercenaria]|uniref:anti-sigma-I factor RsgI6-like n=1 Tax=Mercenaria mercenaria TaxID=6596 RepID=UPI00234F968A|nr:anti-sigma-I factor RsgI6-like [Mercenaria mercenaria]